MGDNQTRVKGFADTVSGVVANNTVVETMCVGFNNPANHVDLSTRTNSLDAAHHRFTCTFDQKMGFFINGPDFEHCACISVHSVVVSGDVDIDNVAIFKWAIIGDAVANYFVDRGAQGLWKSHVTQA